MANNVNSSSRPSSPVSPPPGFPPKNPMVSSQVRAVVDSSIVAQHNDHLPQKMSSSTHHNPLSHHSLREIDTKAKKKFIASNIVAVTEVVKTTQVVSSSPKPDLLAGHVDLPDLNDSVFNHHQDSSLPHGRHLYASRVSSHYRTESMTQRRRRLATRNKKRPLRLVQSLEGLTIMPENPNGREVGRRDRRRTVDLNQPDQAGPSQQATAYGGEEALIEVEVKWEI